MVKKAKARPKKTAGSVAGRSRKLSRKQRKEKARKEADKQPPIPGSFKLIGQVYGIFRRNWKVLGGIVLIYLFLNIVFASSVLSNLNNSVSNIHQSHHLSDAWSGYTSLISQSSSSGSQQAGYSLTQSLLLVLESLVIIWALRQLLAGEKIRVKQAYYQSMAPLVPFLLVIFFILLQLLPVTLGTAFLALVLSSTITGGGLVTVIFAIIFAALTAWSIYMVSGSIFALYIVTLPDMQPRQALRSAKKLVYCRRWPLLRRLFFLPIFTLIALGVITVPLIVVLPILVVPVFFLLIMLTVLFAHTYLYDLYRSLIA